MAKKLARFMILLLALAQMGASCHGTETGNPGGTGTPSSCPAAFRAPAFDQAAGSDDSLDELILRICQKIIGCGVATTTDTCFNALNGEDGDRMIDELGFTGGTTILQLRQALLAGTLAANTTGLVTCEADLSAVNCSAVNAVVTGTDFAQTETFIPDSCVVVFASPQASTGNNNGCP